MRRSPSWCCLVASDPDPGVPVELWFLAESHPCSIAAAPSYSVASRGSRRGDRSQVQRGGTRRMLARGLVECVALFGCLDGQ